MPIVGFNFDKVSAERKGNIQKGMRATHNITINSIKEEDLSLGKEDKRKGLRFNFEYNVKYDPKVGEVIILGHILFLEEAKKIKDILIKWEKDKKIEEELMAQLINTAIVKSTIKTLSVSQDVNLPPHLPIPTIARRTVQTDKKAKEYIG